MTAAEKDYELYLERYCEQHKISKEKAEKHSLVREIKSYYETNAREILPTASTFTPSGECK